jgi:Fur family transcriptional regulator, ferric uptake regulator
MNKKKLNIDAVRELLRSKSLRATPARIAVIRFLQESDHPMTHLDVTEKLVLEGYEKSTIFRALADMTEVGLVRKMELGDHVWRFERIGESERDGSAHPHLLCVDCGTIQCLNDNQVELKTSKSVGEVHDVLLKGRCRDCRDGD